MLSWPKSLASPPAAILQLDGAWFELRSPGRCLVARQPCEVSSVLSAAEHAASSGGHVAGFVAYEAAEAFGLASHAPVSGLPLAEFVVFEDLVPFDTRTLAVAATAARDLDWESGMREDAHAAAVGRIREHLAAGDTYQVNFTFPLTARFDSNPFALFARLARAQGSSCMAFLDFGRFAICSASPELFFARDGERIVMRPMKGTARRGRILAEDRRLASALRRSPKERAENLMIVDMVRNDLGRFARPGSVQVPELFNIERFPTVLQMTSTVVAETDATVTEVFAATFPCASVTGAPKVRTAAIIRELEAGPRGVYTGAVGYLGPGRKARFNVAIRTATIDRLEGMATYGVGSGIVWDSRARREYTECLAKAQVLTADAQAFSLLETMRWEPGQGFDLLERHLRRQAASARFFGIPYDLRRVRRMLNDAVGGTETLRIRLLVDEAGEPTIESAPLLPLRLAATRVGLARSPVDQSDPFLFHKTTRRAVHERAKASRPDCDQVILWTPAGRITETDIGNLAVFREGRWITPPVTDGLLGGTLRAELLAQGIIREGHVGVGELRPEARIAVFNAVRGWQTARFVP